MKKLLLPVITILVAAILLLLANLGLKQLEKDNTRIERDKIMSTLLPGSIKFREETYTGDDANIRRVHKGETGYVIETGVQGYADQITMLIGVSQEGEVTGLVVRNMAETFGLGANALNDHEFLAQFLNTCGDAQVGTNVDAITGATVTSKAIARSVNSAVAYVTGADIDSGATSWGG